jgi:hypothetical protein
MLDAWFSLLFRVDVSVDDDESRQSRGLAAVEPTRATGLTRGNPRRHGEMASEVKVPLDAGQSRRQDPGQPYPSK